jgi:hypothetical protein
MSDVPSTAVCCSESIECFLGMASKVLFKHFVTIPVAPVTTDITFHASHCAVIIVVVAIIIIYSSFVKELFSILSH